MPQSTPYYLGCVSALLKLGVEGAPLQRAEDFANVMGKDQTADAVRGAEEPVEDLRDRPPMWSGNSSLEAGDVGTRNSGSGLPSSGAV